MTTILRPRSCVYVHYRQPQEASATCQYIIEL